MKIVLDTNVLISGIFFSGPPSRILKAWKDSKFQIILSREILSEYQRVGKKLAEKYSPININPILELLTIYGEIVDTEGISISICEDTDDNKFFECAIAGGGKLIVSGDRHLLKASGFQGIVVIKPRNFIETYL